MSKLKREAKLCKQSKERFPKKTRRWILRRRLAAVRRRVRQESLNWGVVINAPRKFFLHDGESHEALVAFLEKLRGAFAEGYSSVLVDFTPTKMIVAGGGLLLYSEINRLKLMFPNVKLRCRPSRDMVVNQVLKHLELFRLFSHRSKVVARRPDVVSWRHAVADDINCTKAGAIIETYKSLKNDTSKLLYKAASEAISNAINHAYGSSRKDGLPDPESKYWWMFCREEAKRFYMSVCDLGVGIPATLTVKNTSEALTRILEKISFGGFPSDSAMIEAAMEYARTRTENPHQGKGLMDLRRIIDEKGEGILYVFSNKGCVTYTNGAITRFDFKRSILGTIIVWSIPLSVEEGVS